jgi:hypothetical protein
MFKVLLLIVLFNSSTGEIQGIWNQQGQLPAFESREACELVVSKEVPPMLADLPQGMTLSATCIEPGADHKSETGKRT